MTVRAIVVGIDRYAEPEWDRAGPAANALAVASWLLETGVAPADIALFLSPGGHPTLHQDLVTRGADDATIRNFIAEDLAKGCRMGSTLFLYWSGHGMVQQSTGHRLLFSSDYRSTRPNLVLDVDDLFQRVRTAAYPCFDELFALLDTCGVRSDAAVAPPQALPFLAPRPARHLVYYATPEDEFALADSGTSGFTGSALAVLRSLAAWPDHAEFDEALTRRLEALDLPRFRLSYKGNEVGGREGDIYGRARSAAEPAVTDLVDTLLAERYDVFSVAGAYRATTRTLGGRIATVEVEGVPTMVRELADLGDGAARLPSGLVQFALRVAGLSPELDRAVGGWLSRNARLAPPGLVGAEQQRLSLEGERKLLLLFFEFDHLAGAAKEPRASLRNQDMTLVQGMTFGDIERKVSGSTAEWMRVIFGRLDDAGFAADLEVHVVSDPELMDERFHDLPTLTDTVGVEFPVVLHYAERFNKPNTPRAQTWKRQYDELMKLDPGRSDWGELTEDRELPPGARPWLAGPSAAAGPNAEDKKRLRWLLHSGAPLVYWSHVTTPEGLAARLRDFCVRGTFAQLPGTLREARHLKDAVGQNGSLIWDEPTFPPSHSSRGIAWT